MRGQQSLFTDLFTPLHTTTSGDKKGRCTDLNEQRNECLMDRYFYYARYHSYRYDVCIAKVAAEFFLSAVTIPKIMELPTNQAYLRGLKQTQPAKKYFTSRWPHLVWG